jgi:hypothetical protein
LFEEKPMSSGWEECGLDSRDALVRDIIPLKTILTMAKDTQAPPGFRVTGVEGLNKLQIMGVYNKTDEVVNGKPVFSNVDTSGAFCCW